MPENTLICVHIATRAYAHAMSFVADAGGLRSTGSENLIHNRLTAQGT